MDIIGLRNFTRNCLKELQGGCTHFNTKLTDLCAEIDILDLDELVKSKIRIPRECQLHLIESLLVCIRDALVYRLSLTGKENDVGDTEGELIDMIEDTCTDLESILTQIRSLVPNNINC